MPELKKENKKWQKQTSSMKGITEESEKLVIRADLFRNVHGLF